LLAGFLVALAICWHSAACFKNSSAGLIGVIGEALASWISRPYGHHRVANKTGNRLVIPLSLVQATRMIARGWKAAESLAREVSINCALPHIGAPKNM
jgi:hypothetical protein